MPDSGRRPLVARSCDDRRLQGESGDRQGKSWGNYLIVHKQSHPQGEPTAEQRMWAYYVTERSKGRKPTGAELDRIAGTNNYGRRVLRRWRESANPADRGSNGDRPQEVSAGLGQRSPANTSSSEGVVV
jgi:hypothetical protein